MLIEGDIMKTNSNKDIKLVMLFFVVISLILCFSLVNNFKVIDCFYFIIVLFFATRYLLVSRN